MKLVDVVGGVIVGIILMCTGFMFVFQRKRVIDALLSSNRVFWEKMNCHPSADRNRIVANIMIPFMGLVFMAGGIASIVKVMTYMTGAY